MKSSLHYTIRASDPAAHLFTITLTVRRPDPAGQRFSLPAWIPGSYMIREFARNIVRIRAESNGATIELTKLDKHTWQAAPCAAALTLHYEVYAWDLSVRAAHLDQTHGFFNGSSVFLAVHGQEHDVHVIEIQKPLDPGCAKWRVATALPERKAKRYGFGTYQAKNYDELIDHPVELGEFVLATFNAHGVPHDIAITGRVPQLDLPRLCADLKKICEAQIALFEPRSKQAPMARYVFLTMAVGDGYGGLEHRASTALLCARADLPVLGQTEMSDGYRGFLGLCSHEYFHSWNVKRIKPAAFAPYRLDAESYTPLLWLFEGGTSYYDNLMLLRSGVIDVAAYLKLIAKDINGVLRGTGRSKQSVAESSFDAWTKYYRQDENAPNAIVSYYAKGSLIALALDLNIRAASAGKKSLDDVMRALWQRYGRDFYLDTTESGRGVTEAELHGLFDQVTGLKISAFLQRYVVGTEDLPLAKLLAPFAIECVEPRAAAIASLNLRSKRDGNDCKVANVYEGGAAHQAGVSAGDVLLAIDGLRVPATGPDALLKRYRVGDRVVLHVFRRDELLQLDALLAADDVRKFELRVLDKPALGLRLRQGWLQR